MSGFRAPRKLYQLVFEDEDLAGLEVIASGLTLGERRDYLKNEPDNGDVLLRLDYDIAYFVDHIKSWNLEDEDGNALPIEPESLSALDSGHVRAMLTTWMQRVNRAAAVSPDLGKASNDGSTTATTPSMEASLPMESLP